MAENYKLTKKLVRELLDYNPRTGILTWRKRQVGLFSDAAHCKVWNIRWAGKRFGNVGKRSGHRSGRIFWRTYRSGRIIWLWMTGEWPKHQVDHKNRIRDDDRWSNLQDVTNAQNSRNQSLRSNNTSGFVGVLKLSYGKYEARIFVNNKCLILGYYSTFDKAVAARKRANKKYGYSKGHGHGKI